MAIGPEATTTAGSAIAPSDAASLHPEGNSWTKEELEQLGLRQLGRLKSQGVDVGEVYNRKKKQGKKGGRMAELMGHAGKE